MVVVEDHLKRMQCLDSKLVDQHSICKGLTKRGAFIHLQVFMRFCEKVTEMLDCKYLMNLEI